MTIQEIAQQYYNEFETKEIQRHGETEPKTIVHFNETDSKASQELRESVYKAHGDRLPNDWIFETYRSLLNRITEYETETLDQLQDNRSEIVDSEVSVYTYDLTGWLHENNSNVYYLDEAIREFGTPENGFKLLAMAQYMAIDEIYSEVYSLLQEAYEKQESEDE